MSGGSWIVCAGLLGALGVAAGAFGAHGLEGKLTPQALHTYEVAVRYQLFHALALLAVGFVVLHHPSAAAQVAGGALLVGTLIFAGFLYAWVFTGIRLFALVVPIGGVALILGWIALAVAGWNIARN